MQPFYNPGTKHLTLQLGAGQLLFGRVEGGLGVAILLWGLFKILFGFGDHFQTRKHYLGGHFNKYHESSIKQQLGFIEMECNSR